MLDISILILTGVILGYVIRLIQENIDESREYDTNQ